MELRGVMGKIVRGVIGAGFIFGLMFVLSGNVSAEAASLGSLDMVLTQHESGTDSNSLISSVHDKASDTQEVTVKWDDNYTEKDLRYMACIIYCEAGDMGLEAQIAVANVVLNRMNNTKDWAHVTTIKEVIYDNKWGVQFTPTKKKNGTSSMDRALAIYDSGLDPAKCKSYQISYMKSSIEAAKAAFCNVKAVPDNYLYFNGHISATQQKCTKNEKSYKIIDSHIYY